MDQLNCICEIKVQLPKIKGRSRTQVNNNHITCFGTTSFLQPASQPWPPHPITNSDTSPLQWPVSSSVRPHLPSFLCTSSTLYKCAFFGTSEKNNEGLKRSSSRSSRRKRMNGRQDLVDWNGFKYFLAPLFCWSEIHDQQQQHHLKFNYTLLHVSSSFMFKL